MESQRRALKITFLLALFLFPLFGLLDIAVYPDYLIQLLTIRAVITALIALNFFFLNKIKDHYIFPITLILFFLSSFSISLMCFLTGDGLASPYYAGQFIVIITATIFFPMKKDYYVIIVIGCLIQHFVLLLFLPWQIGDLAKNIFFLGGSVFSGWIIRRFINNLIAEINTLQGIIPICSNCKKVRNDKGYWGQVESYISEHSEVQFSHSICPDCAKELYGDYIKRI